MQTAEPNQPPLDPSAGAPRRRRRRHSAKRRRRALGAAIAVWIGGSALMALAGSGVASYIAYRSGPTQAAPGTAVADLVAELFGSHDGAADGTGAMCRIGDAGTLTLAELLPPGSTLAALTKPLACTIGDPGTVTLAELSGRDRILARAAGDPRDDDRNDLDSLSPSGGGSGRTDRTASRDGDDTSHGPSDQIPPLADNDPTPDLPPLVPLAGGGRPQFRSSGGGSPSSDPPADDPPRNSPGGPQFPSFSPFDPGFSGDPGNSPTPQSDGPLVITADIIEVPEPSTLAVLAASCAVLLLGARHRRAARDRAARDRAARDRAAAA